MVSIIALLFTAVAMSIGNVVRANLRAEANKLSANIQAVSNRAVTKNAYYRMVFDFEANEYWSEVAEQRFFIGSLKEEDAEKSMLKEKDKDKQRMGEVQFLETTDEPSIHQASASEVKDGLIRRIKLPNGLSLSGIMTTHQRDVRREGKGYIYFFPDGSQERALVYITDGNQVYTLATQPLTGRVTAYRGEVAPGEEFEDQDEDDD